MKEKFLKELELLLAKYDVKFVSHESYNGEDVWIGTDYYLKFGDDTDYSETLAEIIKKIMDK